MSDIPLHILDIIGHVEDAEDRRKVVEAITLLNNPEWLKSNAERVFRPVLNNNRILMSMRENPEAWEEGLTSYETDEKPSTYMTSGDLGLIQTGQDAYVIRSVIQPDMAAGDLGLEDRSAETALEKGIP